MADDRNLSQRLSDFLPYRLSITSNAVSQRISDRYRTRFGLKVTEWRVIAVLGDAGQVTQRALADLTLLDKVAVNRACKVLGERGLVRRLPNTRDGRSHLLELTEEGAAIHDEVMPMVRAEEAAIFECLDEDEIVQLRSMLDRLLEQSGETGGD